jgi:hypothetical protein
MHDIVDYIIVGVVYACMGIWSGHVGRVLNHSKPLRLLEIFFWPAYAAAFGCVVVFLGVYTSVPSVSDILAEDWATIENES